MLLPTFVHSAHELFKKTSTQLVIILCVASVFRLTNLNLVEFKLDEALTVFQLEQFFHKPHLFKTGLVTSTGAYALPLFHYILLAFAWISRNPMFLSFFIGLINVVAIGGLFLLVKKHFFPVLAWLTALTIAVSPWSVLLSRKIWAQDLILPFGVGVLYWLVSYYKNLNTWAAFFLFLTVGLFVQLHGSVVFIVIPFFISLFFLKKPMNLNQMVGGFLIAFIPALPFVFRELTSVPVCPSCQALSAYNGASKLFTFKHVEQPFNLVLGRDLSFVMGSDIEAFQNQFPVVQYFDIFYVTVILMSILGFLLARAIRWWQVVGVCLVFPILLFTLFRIPPYPHYAAVLLLPAALCISFGLSYWVNHQKKLFRLASRVIFSFFCLANIVSSWLFFSYLKTNQSLAGDYGPVFAVTHRTVTSTLEPFRQKPNYKLAKHYAYLFANDSTFLSKLGDFYLHASDPHSAAYFYSSYLVHYPDQVAARKGLVLAYLALGEDELAMKELDVLKTLSASEAASLETLVARFKTGNGL